MKIAIISDIHSNVYALSSVIDDIDDQKADTIICLGDLVGYGPHPNETISYIRRKGILSLKGNYDASVVDNDYSYIRQNQINSFTLPWTVSELRLENKFFLQSLPETITMTFNKKTIKFVHGSTNKINEYLLENEENTKQIMKDLKEDVLACAHTHIPSVKDFDGKLFINSGSVGKPKIGSPESTYCLLDIDYLGNITSQIRSVPYEVKKIIKDMTMLDFPSDLVRSFETGLE